VRYREEKAADAKANGNGAPSANGAPKPEAAAAGNGAPKPAPKQAAVDGNEATARVAYQMADVSFIYPITPATPMGEAVDQWASESRTNAFGNVMQVRGAAALPRGAIGSERRHAPARRRPPCDGRPPCPMPPPCAMRHARAPC
jgi:hypothetical protein